MKQFKKKRVALPRSGTIERLIKSKKDPVFLRKYLRELSHSCQTLPMIVRETTLARVDPNKRCNIAYYPDLKYFLSMEVPNRSLPVQKFMDLFRGMLDQEVVDKVIHDLTNYRLEFYRDPDIWQQVYQDENVHSCMSQSALPRCYVHPENHLALAVLYSPGTNTVIARTIVNTHEHWYVRLFGDKLLVDKLLELGYSRRTTQVNEFKMYCKVRGSTRFVPEYDIYEVPYFDFPYTNILTLPHTHDLQTGLMEIIINRGFR